MSKEWNDLNLDESIVREFLDESLSGLDVLRPQLFHLESEGQEGVNAVFRWVHTVKGTSGFLNLAALQSFAHKFENFLQKLKSSTAALDRATVSMIAEGVDLIQDALTNLQQRIVILDSACDGFIRKLAERSGDQKSSEKEQLVEIATEMSAKKAELAEQGSPADIKSALEALEQLLKCVQKEESETEISEKIASIKSVTSKEGVDLTELCKKVLSAFEEVRSSGGAAPCLSSEEVMNATLEIHKTLFPDASEPHFDWDTVVTLVELMPEVIEDFWNLFWTKSVEAETEVVYFTEAERNEKTEESKEEVVQETSKKKVKLEEAPKPEETIRIGAHYLDGFTRRAEALVSNRNYLDNLEREIKPNLPKNLSKELDSALIELQNNIAELQKALFAIRSSRLSELFERIPRMLRQLERDLGKNISLTVHGEDIEVDRSIIGVLGDPMVHLIRNAADHGLETPEKRKSVGKPEAGDLTITATKTDDLLTLEIADDGNGINPEKVLEIAIKKGLAEEEKQYSNHEIYNFLLLPGFSTAEKVTNVSGRGVGMDVVVSSLRNQGGEIHIDSELGKGSTFTLTIPIKQGSLTKEILLVLVDGKRYAINHACLREAIDFDSVQVRKTQKNSLICHRNELIEMINLGDMLHPSLPRTDKAQNPGGRILILEDEQKNLVATRVDQTLNQLQVIINPFDHDFLKVNQFFEGTVVIGSGKPVLVISLKDTSTLLG